MDTSNVEDVYELSPLQRGMFLHSAFDGAVDMYLSQQTYLAEGNLDPEKLVDAWQAVVACHPALRTSFHWEKLDKPLQVVHRKVELPVFRHDWSDVDEDQQGKRLEQLRAEDAAAGFDLTVAPLQRLNVVQFGGGRFALVWTYHHMLMDGWSIPTFIGDLLGHYRAMTAGGPRPPSAPPFRDYIAWLQRQDPEASKGFWVDLLASVEPGRLVPLRPSDPLAATGPVDRRSARLPQPVMDGLRRAAARHRVTLGTLIHAVWASVLHRFTEGPEVVFGCASSGRPPELPDVERIVGVLVNTLPVRVTVPDGGELGPWLRQLQDTYATMRRYEYTPLADIKKWAGVAGQQLFESILSIENYSIDIGTEIGGAAGQPVFRGHGLYDKINYPIALTITPEVGGIQLVVHRDRFDLRFIDDALFRLLAVFDALTTADRVEDLTRAAGPVVTAPRPAVPPTSAPSRDGEHTAPATPLEEQIAEVFREVLDTADVDVTTSFFELGGDSFDAVRAISRIAGASVGALAANPSVRELAAALSPTPAESTALVAVSRDGPLVCTYQQEGMWFMHQFAPHWTTYHVPFTMWLHGDLHLPALEEAIRGLVVRHEALRTRFVDEGGLPRQLIDPPPASLPISVVDLDPDQVVQWGSDLFAEPFDLATRHGFRIAVARLGPGEHAILLVFHHIVTDGWSARVLGSELSALYAAAVAGRDADLPPLEAQPADYAAWERRWLDGAGRGLIGYWRDKLADLPTVDFPMDRPRPSRPAGYGADFNRQLPTEVGVAAHDYARTHRVSLLAVLQAALLTVLHRYTGQLDLPVGSMLAGRTRADLEPMVGYFGNIVVLRTDLDGDPTFAELVERCHSTVLEATSHQDAPFPLVVDAVRPQRVTGRNPLFQIGLTLHPPGLSAGLDLGDVAEETFVVDEHYALWDLAVDVLDAADGDLNLSINYASELFDADRIERLADHLTAALSSGLAAPDARARDVEIVHGPASGPVHQLVAAFAARSPDTVAVVGHDGTATTYQQLDTAANQLAYQLRRLGVVRGVPVGIRLGLCADLVTALLAMGKAGGSYVQLDPGLPPGLTPAVVVTHTEHGAGSGATPTLDVKRAALAAEPTTAPDSSCVSDHLAGPPPELLLPLAAGGTVDLSAYGDLDHARGAYVVDERLRPVPVGVTGQLYVPGTGLVDWYARRRPDGSIERLGRRDQRVEVGGQRVELWQVESMLAGHPGVRQCAVVVHDDAGLTAYVVGEPEPVVFRRYLADRLPTYLVPSSVVVLPELPVTPSGELDPSRLPDPPAGHQPPRTDTERWMATTWQQLIGADGLGANDNLFDAGGNSLNATQLIARVRDAFGVDLHVAEVFANPTIELLAARLDEAVPGGR